MKTRLTDSQLTFINEMKAKGFLGCSMTINGNQTWVSFNNPFFLNYQHKNK